MIATVITTYKCHNDLVDEVIENAKTSTGYVVCVFSKLDDVSLPVELQKKCDVYQEVVQARYGTRQDQYRGEIISTRAGLNVVSLATDAKYVLKLNGDWLVRKPIDAKKHLEYLGDHDFYSTTHSPGSKVIPHCGWFFGKLDILLRVYDCISTVAKGQLERRLHQALTKLNVKTKLLDQFPESEEYKAWYNDFGIWLTGHNTGEKDKKAMHPKLNT